MEVAQQQLTALLHKEFKSFHVDRFIQTHYWGKRSLHPSNIFLNLYTLQLSFVLRTYLSLIRLNSFVGSTNVQTPVYFIDLILSSIVCIHSDWKVPTTAELTSSDLFISLETNVNTAFTRSNIVRGWHLLELAT